MWKMQSFTSGEYNNRRSSKESNYVIVDLMANGNTNTCDLLKKGYYDKA